MWNQVPGCTRVLIHIHSHVANMTRPWFCPSASMPRPFLELPIRCKKLGRFEPKTTGNQPSSHHEPPKGPGQQDKIIVIDGYRWYLEGFSTDFRSIFQLSSILFAAFTDLIPQGFVSTLPQLTPQILVSSSKKGGYP